jgi:membrane fusion protein, multidrug efflux system
MIKTSRLLLTVLLSFPLFAYGQQPPTPVFATVVEKKTFADHIEALGTLRANESVELSATVTERVTRIHFESGQRVKKGTLLLEMDAAEEKALLMEQQSMLEEAERQVERLKPLMERGAASQSAMDTATLNLQTAKARIAAIESRIQERHIVAPFSGKLGLRNISVGTMAQPGTLITTIDDDQIMKLDFSIPDIFLSSLSEGDRIMASSKTFPERNFVGTVESIDSRVDPVTRAISVRALLNNEDQSLRPGMLMSVKLERNPRQTLIIPEESIVPRSSRNFVFVINKGEQPTVSLAEVSLGSRRKGEVEILSGLEAGMQIVTHGTLRLQEGARVAVKASSQEKTSLEKILQEQQTKGD